MKKPVPCITLHDIKLMWWKPVKHTYSVVYSDKTWVFEQSERAQGPF